MKVSTGRLFALLAALSMFGLQACNAYVYDPGGWHTAPGFGWGHGWGWGHRSFGGFRGHGGGGHHRLEMMNTEEPGTQAPQELLVSRYGISSESSETIIQLAKSNERRQAKTLASMGFCSDDISAFAKLEMPSVEGIDKMATSLNEDPTKIHAVVTDFISDIRAEKDAK